MRFDQHTICISGAAGRLGSRLVQQFNAQGATVVALVLNAQEAQRVDLPSGRIFTADLTQEDEVEVAFAQMGQAVERLDALIHTAGGWGMKPFAETSLADWRGLVEPNLTSAFLCFREAARLMAGQEGRLIGITAGQGADRGAAQQAAYSVAKAGVMRLVEAVAAEYAGTGLTAHAIAPSTILYDPQPGDQGVPADDLVAWCMELCTPAGRALNGATLRAYGSAL